MVLFTLVLMNLKSQLCIQNYSVSTVWKYTHIQDFLSYQLYSDTGIQILHLTYFYHCPAETESD